MHVYQIEKKINDQYVRLEATIKQAGKEQTEVVYFEFDREYADFVPENADPFFPMMLLHCVFMNEDLTFDMPVSEELFINGMKIQKVFANWFADENAKTINVTADLIKREKSNQSDSDIAACFFSFGVDSFYSLLNNLYSNQKFAPKTKYIILMEGFEHALAKDTGAKARAEKIKQFADKLSLKAISGRCNWADVLASPAKYLVGCLLASTAYCLSEKISSFIIPSTFTWDTIKPHGTHPYTDEKWSTSLVNFNHDGCDTCRSEKIIKSIEYNELVYLDNMYSCMRSRPNDKACGGCFRCIRNLTTLTILGKDGNARSYEKKFPKHWKRRYIKKRTDKNDLVVRSEMEFVYENYQLSRKHGHPSKMIKEFLEEFMAIAEYRFKLKGYSTISHDIKIPFHKRLFYIARYHLRY